MKTEECLVVLDKVGRMLFPTEESVEKLKAEGWNFEVKSRIQENPKYKYVVLETTSPTGNKFSVSILVRQIQ